MNGPEHYRKSQDWLAVAERMRPGQDETAALSAVAHGLLAVASAIVETGLAVHDTTESVAGWRAVGVQV